MSFSCHTVTLQSFVTKALELERGAVRLMRMRDMYSVSVVRRMYLVSVVSKLQSEQELHVQERRDDPGEDRD